jgi:hypothetical protein
LPTLLIYEELFPPSYMADQYVAKTRHERVRNET